MQHERFARFKLRTSYSRSRTRPRSGCGAEPLASVLVPAAYELGGKRRLLARTHRPHQLFSKLAADDLDQGLVSGDGRGSLRLAQHLHEHCVNELLRPGLLQVSVLGIEGPGLPTCHGHHAEPATEGKVVNHVGD